MAYNFLRGDRDQPFLLPRTLGKARGRGITQRWEREGIFRQLAARGRRAKVVAGGD